MCILSLLKGQTFLFLKIHALISTIAIPSFYDNIFVQYQIILNITVLTSDMVVTAASVFKIAVAISGSLIFPKEF